MVQYKQFWGAGLIPAVLFPDFVFPPGMSLIVKPPPTDVELLINNGSQYYLN